MAKVGTAVQIKSSNSWAAICLSVACSLPFLFAYYAGPSTTALDGLLSVGLWAGVAVMLAMHHRVAGRVRGALLFCLLFLLVTLVSQGWAGSGLSALLQSGGLLAAAALLLHLGMQLQNADRIQLLRAVLWGLLVAGVLNALVAIIQVGCNPDGDTFWLTSSPLAGRAIGNMRQPNHLAALLCLAMLAWMGLQEGQVPGPLFHRVLAGGLLALLVAGVVLSASRMGLYILLPLLLVWGAADRSLPRATRLIWAASIVSAALLTALMVWALGSSAGHQDVIGRLGEGTASPSRMALWRNALELASAHPWFGVGWGQFNFAWTLTPFDNRRGVIVEHCHNLFLQLIVELGWPIGMLISLLLILALWAAFQRVRRTSDHPVLWRSALGMVMVVGVHSMLELPLWYAYFLLPTSFLMGVLLGLKPAQESRLRNWGVPAMAPVLAGVVLALGSVVACHDYLTVSQIFDRNATSPFLQRIQIGQAALFYSEWGDYAAATNFRVGSAALHAAQRAAHHAIDGRLLMRWAENLNADGEEDKANYLMERLREFPNADAKAVFSKCGVEQVSPEASAFPCARASRRYVIEDFSQ